MSIQKNLRHVGVACLLAMLTSGSFAASDAYLEGFAEQTDYRYAQALEKFLVAANEGNQRAQRQAGLMLLYGERVYGIEVKQNRPLAIQLLRQAASSGCEVSQHMLTKHQLAGL